jgi:hypothetical protein
MRAFVTALGWIIAFCTAAGSQQDVVVTGPSGFYVFQDSANLLPNGYVNFPVPLLAPLVTPASSSASCTTGIIEWDANFLYICTSTNNWKRATLNVF